MNEPVPVTITVESTEEDKQGLKVSLWFSAPDIQVDGEREWVVDLKAHTSMQFSTTIRFPAREGSYDVVAGALDYQHGRMVRDYVPVRITVLGGTLYPPSEFTPGVPQPVTTIEVTPLSPLPTPAPETPQPEEQPDETLGPTPTPSPIIVVVNQEVNIPIPDDSTWLTFTIPITTAPSGVTVVGAHAKFLVIHPRGQDLVAEVIGPDGATVYRVWDHKRPTPEDFNDEGRLVPRAYDIPVFIDQPVNGNWTLRLCDERRGKTGTLLIVTLAVAYMPPESGHTTPPRPEVGQVSPEAQSAVAGSWQAIITQTFEGVFPSTGWTVQDLSNDGYTRYWDDDDYRPHWGNWAAWPARGGTHGRNPVAGNDNYFDNMNTRMIYGPFDLSDATMADTNFWLWREMETCCDYLAFEISRDGVAFQELARWSGSAGWEFQSVDYNDYVGDSSVWVAWRFYSDFSVNYDGPWVDDITVRKYVPGQVTARGSFYYYNRNDHVVAARFTKVYLYDDDGDAGPDGSDDVLAETTTDGNGQFQFPALRNWDVDDSSTNPAVRRLDLYVIWETDVQDSQTARRRVTTFGSGAYRWRTGDIRTNASDGYADFYGYTIPNDSDQEPAMWIFQDLRRGWEYINTATGTDPGSATARWEKDKTTFLPCTGTCAWPYLPIGGIFIGHLDRHSPDVIIHELGHQYMYNASGTWWWPNVGDMLACLSHGIQDRENALCAWSEGWADFFALAVNGDACFDWNNTPCSGLNLETPTQGTPGWPNDGDEVEGRVAGALYDLFDQANDGLDQTTFGFGPIWTIVRTTPHEQNFAGFWSSWRAQGYNQHRAVQAIYQNTIDYDTPPTIANLPDRTVLQNFSWNHAIDLWAYSSDPESFDWELDWLITNTSDWRCRVTIDAQDYVDINPLPGWLGSCDVTIRVSDGIKFGYDTFTVRVVPVAARVYLPLVMKNYGGGGTMAVPGETTFTSPLATPDARPQPFESPLLMPEAESGTFRSPLPTPVGP